MKKLTLLFMVTMIALMAGAQGKPALHYYKINGMTFESVGNNPRLALTKESLPKLMKGVVCYPDFDNGDVRLDIITVVGTIGAEPEIDHIKDIL